MSAMPAGSDGASTGSSAYADSAKYASWGRSSDGGSGRGSTRAKDNLTVFRKRGRKSGGFLMGNLFQPREDDDNKNEPPKPSRLAQNVAAPDSIHGAPPAPQTSLDPSQLVQMALSLSEGRRRHVSANLQVPSTPAAKRRVQSSGAPVIHVSPGSPMGNDVLRPVSLDDSGYRPSAEHESARTPADDVDYDFSQATLHRAERARNFFELSSQYRRLLSSLPPLKPTTSVASPRSESSQKELGREYNPLQLLRNRRARHREQRPLDPPVEAYDNIQKVKSYIDEVEHEASDATYRASFDTSLLPSFRRPSRAQDDPPQKVTRNHKRSDTAVSRTLRPEHDWSFTPAELMADAVWLLQPGNRACIENRHGHRIFPQQPRSSFESNKSGRKSGDSRPSITRTNTWGSTIKSDDETDRGRKKPKFLSLRHVDNSARKHLFRNRSRSSSVSSATSARPYNRKKQISGPGDAPDLDNTGPLERQMKKLIENESMGIDPDSPDFVSPDKWDRGHDQPNGTTNISPTQAESPSVNTHKRNNPSKTDESIPSEDRARSSFDDSTAPNSPMVPSHIPSFGMSLSPPASRQSSPERKFGLFRSSRNPSDDKIHRTDFAAASQASLPSSRQVSDNVEPPRSSLDSLRPPMPGIKRHRTTNSITNTLLSSGRRMSKDVGVGRFFKGGRIGDLVRSDSSRQSEKSRRNQQDMSDSETDPQDQDENRPRKIPPTGRSNSTLVGTTSKQKEKEKQKLHNPNLPTFRSSNQIIESDAENDHIARQSKLHREESRSSRFDRLAPPQIRLPRNDSPSVSPTRKTPISRNSSDGGYRSDQDMLTPLRKTRQPGIFETNLSTVETSSPAASRQSSPSKRHWSISDRHDPSQPEAAVAATTSTITTLDVARVRALYLSSGIKAQEINLRANATASPPSPFFVSAAKTSNQGIHPVRLKEEFTVAARMLHHALQDQSSHLSSQLSAFRSNDLTTLHDRLADLRIKVDEKFTPRVHSTADEADAFTVALTTQHTLSIKQVNDAIDGILRRRRRKLIFLQKASWTVLEWIVLGLLWGVWFVVVLLRGVRGVVGVVVGCVRWLLWL